MTSVMKWTPLRELDSFFDEVFPGLALARPAP